MYMHERGEYKSMSAFFFQMVSLFFIQQVEVDGVQCMLEILDTAGQVTNLSRYYKTISLLIQIHVRNMEHHTIFAACMFLHIYACTQPAENNAMMFSVYM